MAALRLYVGVEGCVTNKVAHCPWVSVRRQNEKSKIHSKIKMGGSVGRVIAFEKQETERYRTATEAVLGDNLTLRSSVSLRATSEDGP